MASVPIQSHMLRWAMEQSGYSAEEFARVVSTPVETVNAWLADEDFPNKAQASTISKKLGRSIPFFFLPRPPESAVEASAMFRGSTDPDAVESPEQVAAIRQAQKVQKIAAWGEAGTVVAIPQATIDETPADVAARFRTALDWSLREQKQLSKSGVYKALRSRVEALGVITLMQPVGAKSCRGFSIPHREAPVIFVNSDYKSPALRAFTLIHELAHLSLGHERICYTENSNEEVWCNRVAAEFVLPRAEVLAYAEYKEFARITTSNLDPVRLTANYFKVSWHAVAIRYKQLGYTDQDVIDLIASHPAYEQEPGFNPNGEPRTTPVVRLEEYGSYFPALIFRAVESKRLSEIEASRLFRANTFQLEQMKLTLRQVG